MERKGPAVLIGLSGKRKSGKDYVSDAFIKRGEELGLRVIRRGVSYPLKEEYGIEHNLDGERLKFDFEYKEKVRKEMVVWGEEIRRKDPSYFCRRTIEAVKELQSVDILIISDCRRPTDLAYFKNHYNSVFVRVTADIEIRKGRGWEFQDGVDNTESECGLDDYEDWDFVIKNEGNEIQLHEDIYAIIDKLGVPAK